MALGRLGVVLYVVTVARRRLALLLAVRECRGRRVASDQPSAGDEMRSNASLVDAMRNSRRRSAARACCRARRVRPDRRDRHRAAGVALQPHRGARRARLGRPRSVPRRDSGVDHAIYNGHLRSDKAPGQPHPRGARVPGRARASAPSPAAHAARARRPRAVVGDASGRRRCRSSMLVALMFLASPTRFAPAERRARGRARCSALCTMMLAARGEPLRARPRRAVRLRRLARDRATPDHAAARPRSAGSSPAWRCSPSTSRRSSSSCSAGTCSCATRARSAGSRSARSPPLARAGAGTSGARSARRGTRRRRTTRACSTARSEGGYSIPALHGSWSVLFGNRGLWLGRADRARRRSSPRSGSRYRATGARAPARDRRRSRSSFPYLVLCAGWSGLPLLEEPGPRYLIPALPFLAVPLAGDVGPARGGRCCVAAVVGAR